MKWFILSLLLVYVSLLFLSKSMCDFAKFQDRVYKMDERLERVEKIIYAQG